MVEDRLLGLLGLARRAGKLVLGSTQCLNGVRQETLHLVILDGSTQGNTRKMFVNACQNHRIPLIELKGSDVLGPSIGKPGNKVAGVKDEAFARQAIKKYGVDPEVKALEQN